MARSFDKLEKLWLSPGAMPTEELWVTGQTTNAIAVLGPADEVVVAGEEDGVVRFLHSESRELLSCAKEHAAPVTCVVALEAAVPRAVASGDAAGGVLLWREEEAEAEAEAEDGAAAESTKKIKKRKWKVANRLGPHSGAVRGMVATAEALVTAGADGKVVLHSISESAGSSSARVLMPETAETEATCVALSPDETLLAVGRSNGGVHVFEAGTWAEALHIQGEADESAGGGPMAANRPVSHVAFFEGIRSWLAVATGEPFGSVSVWDVRRDALVHWKRMQASQTSEAPGVRHMVVSGAVLCFSSGDSSIFFWAKDLGINSVVEAEAPVTSLVRRSAPREIGSRCVISGHANGHICVWRTQDQQLMQQLDGHHKSIGAIYATRWVLASGSVDMTVRVWRVARDDERSDEDAANARAVAAAVRHKEKGNSFFGAGKFMKACDEYDEAIRLNCREAAFHSNRAACLLRLGHNSKAVEACDQAIAVGVETGIGDTMLAKVLARKSDALYSSRKYQEALNVLEKCLLLRGADPILTEKRQVIKDRLAAAAAVVDAGSRLRAGQASEARSLFEKAIALNPETLYRLEYVDCLAKLGDHDACSRECAAVMRSLAHELPAAGSRSRKDVDTLVHVVETHAAAQEALGNLRDAVQLLQQSLELRPARAAIQARIDALQEQRRATEGSAAVEAEAAQQRAERKARADQLKEQGNKAFHRKASKEALDLYTQAIDLVGGAEPVYFSNRAAVYMQMRSFRACVKDCEAALDLIIDGTCATPPDKALESKLLARKGSALMELGENDDAVFMFEEALKVTDSDVVRAKLSKARANLEQDNFKSTMDDISEDQANGDRALDARMYGDAVDYYSRAIERDPQRLYPQSALLFLSRATAHLMKDEYVGALADCEASLSVDGSNKAAWSLKGNLLSVLKRYRESIRAYLRCLELDASQTEIAERLKNVVLICLADERDAKAKGKAKGKAAARVAETESGRAALRLIEDPAVKATLALIQRHDIFSVLRELKDPDVIRKLATLYTEGILGIPDDDADRSMSARDQEEHRRRQEDESLDNAVFEWAGKKRK